MSLSLSLSTSTLLTSLSPVISPTILPSNLTNNPPVVQVNGTGVPAARRRRRRNYSSVVPFNGTSVRRNNPRPNYEPGTPPRNYEPNTYGKEVHRCFGAGEMATRTAMIYEADKFCDKYRYVELKHIWEKLSYRDYRACGHECSELFDMEISMHSDNCVYTMEGGGPLSDCGRRFRVIIDQCDTKDVLWKHGGYLDDECVSFLIDPNTE